MTTQKNTAKTKRGDLTTAERQMLQVAAAGNVQEAARLLKYKDVRINCLDENGMTPLMHAAYKGQAGLCRLLLQHRADVNCNEHEYGYTALMFASLSGNAEITWMMLDAGAETDLVNSVGRTAAQMAAFVGQHDCVTVINNFFSRTRLEYYTRPQGLEKEPILPPKLAEPLHKIIMTTNRNPVKMVMMVKENPLLVEVVALEKCYQVMDMLCEQSECDDKLDALLKSFLKGRDSDGFPEYQEKFIHDCMRRFPYCEATLLYQLVQNIAPGGSGDSPTALSVLTQALTGQMALMDAEFCSTCGERGADKKCSYCEMIVYCGQACQKLHWFTHKKVCKALQRQKVFQNEDSSSDREIRGNDDGHDAIEGNCSSLLGLCLGFYPDSLNAVAETMSGCQDWGGEDGPSS